MTIETVEIAGLQFRFRCDWDPGDSTVGLLPGWEIADGDVYLIDKLSALEEEALTEAQLASVESATGAILPEVAVTLRDWDEARKTVESRLEGEFPNHYYDD